jgi:hypothetical protein
LAVLDEFVGEEDQVLVVGGRYLVASQDRHMERLDFRPVLEFEGLKEVASEYGDVEIGGNFDIDQGRIADNEIGGNIFDFLLEFAQGLAVVIEFGGKGDVVGEEVVGVDLDEGDPVFEIGDFFQFHDLVVVVDCFFVEGVGQQVDDGLVDVF